MHLAPQGAGIVRQLGRQGGVLSEPEGETLLERVRTARLPLLAGGIAALAWGETGIAVSHGAALKISPDGRHVVFAAVAEDKIPRLWVRPLESLASRPLAGTEGAASPFWSPAQSQFLKEEWREDADWARAHREWIEWCKQWAPSSTCICAMIR